MRLRAKKNKSGGARYTAVLTLVVLVLSAGAVQSQVFYLYPGAPVAKESEPLMGAAMGIGDNLFRVLGYARFNINPTADFGLELVLDHLDGSVGSRSDTWRVGAGADIKYAIVPKNSTLPFDLSVNGGLGFESGGNFTNINVPLGGLISRPLELNNGSVIVPYGGVYVIISHVSFDTDLPGIDNDDTDADVELRGGAKLYIKDRSSVFASLHLGAGDMFFFGLNINL